MSPPPSEVWKATSRRFFVAVAALVDAGRLLVAVGLLQ